MKKREATKARIEFLRRAAVSVVMRSGRFESSGAARLCVFRRKEVMITYRTPFNSLPPLSDRAKFCAAKDGKTARLMPYGIDVWQLDVGKVMSLGWRGDEAAVTDLYRPGDWERFFGTFRTMFGRHSKPGTAESPVDSRASAGKNTGRVPKCRARLRGH